MADNGLIIIDMPNSKEQWIIIVNVYAASRKAGALWRDAEALLEAEGVDYRCYMTGKDGNACELARAASEDGYRRIVAVGGDGTVHDVLNGIMMYVDSQDAVRAGVSVEDFTLAVLPLGSGNDWIKSTGVPRNMKKAISMLAAESFRKQDIVRVTLGEADGLQKSVSYMVNVGGTGLDADVCRIVNVNKKLGYRGKILYVTALLRCLRKRVPVSVRVLCDGKEFYSGNILSIAYGVGKYSGGGMRQTADAVLDDGLLDVTLIPDLPVTVIARKAPKLFTGTFTKVKEVFVCRCRKVEVLPESVCPYTEVDGEVIGQAPVSLEVLPDQVNVLGTV